MEFKLGQRVRHLDGTLGRILEGPCVREVRDPSDGETYLCTQYRVKWDGFPVEWNNEENLEKA